MTVYVYMFSPKERKSHF